MPPLAIDLNQNYHNHYLLNKDLVILVRQVNDAILKTYQLPDDSKIVRVLYEYGNCLNLQFDLPDWSDSAMVVYDKSIYPDLAVNAKRSLIRDWLNQVVQEWKIQSCVEVSGSLEQAGEIKIKARNQHFIFKF